MSVPTKDEAAAYYFTYINRIAEDDIVGVMERQLGEATSLFSTISEDKSLYRYAPEKWTIRQSLNHVSDTERAFAFRALWFGRGFTTPMASYEQNVAAWGAGADVIHWTAHVDEFRQVRRSTISLFRNMPAIGWTRSGIASDNRVTVPALAYMIAGHFAHHAGVVRERYL